jgi:hypothetical protein
MLGGLTKDLCQMQRDGKACFYKDVSIDKYLEKIRPLTECESVLGLSILEIRNVQLAPALQAREGMVPVLQPIATWNYPSFGSFVLPISESNAQYVIVFNRSTFTALLDLLKSITAIIPIAQHQQAVGLSYDPASIAEALEAQPDILTRVAIQLANIITNRGNEIDLETLPLNSNQLLLAVRALDAVELFMLAHEYGHQHHHHYKPRNDETRSARYEGLTVAQEREIDADIYGQELLLQLADKTFAENPITALVYRSGAEIFLAIEELMHKARQSVGKDLSQLAIYPPPRQRALQVVDVQAKQRSALPHLFQADLGAPYKIASDVLWQKLEGRFPAIYKAIDDLKSGAGPQAK